MDTIEDVDTYKLLRALSERDDIEIVVSGGEVALVTDDGPGARYCVLDISWGDVEVELDVTVVPDEISPHSVEARTTAVVRILGHEVAVDTEYDSYEYPDPVSAIDDEPRLLESACATGMRAALEYWLEHGNTAPPSAADAREWLQQALTSVYPDEYLEVPSAEEPRITVPPRGHYGEVEDSATGDAPSEDARDTVAGDLARLAHADPARTATALLRALDGYHGAREALLRELSELDTLGL